MSHDIPRRPRDILDEYEQLAEAFTDIPTRQQWETVTRIFGRMSDSQQELVADFLGDWLTPNVRRRLAASGEVPDHWMAVFRAAGYEVTVPASVALDVAVFNRLLAIWQKMWNDAGRYGPAGLKIRRGLIFFLALIIVTFVLDVAAAHLTDHQLAELAVAGSGTAVVVTVAKK